MTEDRDSWRGTFGTDAWGQAVDKEGEKRLLRDTDLDQFFGEVVLEAVRERGTTTTDAVANYLGGLLTDFVRPRSDVAPFGASLTLLLHEARQRQGMERFEQLRGVGDGVLYIAGFFPEYFEKRGVEIGYVSSLGAQAYNDVSRMLNRLPADTEGTRCDIFRELADNFSELARLLHDVGEGLMNCAGSNQSTVRLYERWLRSGSATAARMLGERGIVPLRGERSVN